MDQKTKSALSKSYSGYDRAELEDTLNRAKTFLANPGDANAETIQGANDTVEFITEILATPPVDSGDDSAATDSKMKKREAAIASRMTESRGALNRAQAEIAVDAQTAEDAANAKAKAKK